VNRARLPIILNHDQFMNPSGAFNSGTFAMVTAARDPRVAKITTQFLF
jgi:hypothetical protein